MSCEYDDSDWLTPRTTLVHHKHIRYIPAMNRIDRLTAILIYLQGRRRTTLEALEDRFEVGRRTIFRDIKALLEAGVPIGGDAGQGYFIVEGYHLPPVVFSKEEAASILTGQKLIEHWTDTKTHQTFTKAMDKVKAVLKYRDQAFLENLEKQISVVPHPGRQFQQSLDLHLEELQYAAASNRCIEILYFSPAREEGVRRVVEPLGLVNYSSKWHLIGYCRLRKSLRDFRTDRISELCFLRESFDPGQHPDYMEFLNETLTGTDAREVQIHLSRMVYRMIGDQKYYMGLTAEKRIGDWVAMTFYTASIDYFARWLLSFGNQVKVINPDDLKMKISALLKELSEHHEG